jgi:hypothetical protein
MSLTVNGIEVTGVVYNAVYVPRIVRVNDITVFSFTAIQYDAVSLADNNNSSNLLTPSSVAAGTFRSIVGFPYQSNSYGTATGSVLVLRHDSESQIIEDGDGIEDYGKTPDAHVGVRVMASDNTALIGYDRTETHAYSGYTLYHWNYGYNKITDSKASSSYENTNFGRAQASNNYDQYMYLFAGNSKVRFIDMDSNTGATSSRTRSNVIARNSEGIGRTVNYSKDMALGKDFYAIGGDMRDENNDFHNCVIIGKVEDIGNSDNHYVYSRVMLLTAPSNYTSTDSASFGMAVSIMDKAGENPNTLMVGCRSYDTYNGSAIIYNLDDMWNQDRAHFTLPDNVLDILTGGNDGFIPLYEHTPYVGNGLYSGDSHIINEIKPGLGEHAYFGQYIDCTSDLFAIGENKYNSYQGRVHLLDRSGNEIGILDNPDDFSAGQFGTKLNGSSRCLIVTGDGTAKHAVQYKTSL